MTWDEYFFEICIAVAKKSNCLSRKIGAVIVKDNALISSGYNGPPRNVPHCSDRLKYDKDLLDRFSLKSDKPYTEDTKLTECPRYTLGAKSGEMTYICPAGHAERNAIVQSARNGVSVKDCTIYMNCPVPCFECLKEIINSGIKEIVCTSLNFYDSMGRYLLNNSKDLLVRTYDGEYYKRWKQ